MLCCYTMHSSWIYISLSFLSSCICIVHALSFSNFITVSYTDHCSSTVPQSIPTNSTSKNFIPCFITPHFTNGESLIARKTLNQTDNYIGKSLLLELQPKFYKTDANGIFKVEASLFILYAFPFYHIPGYEGSYYENTRDQEAITFLLEGFWSQISGNLCMVGSAYLEVEGDRLINLDAVLKLNYADEENPTVYTSVVSGILESTLSANDPGYFDSILIYSFLVFPNYTYSLEPKGEFSNDRAFPKDRSLSLESTSFCSVVAAGQIFLELEYAAECRETQHCSPLASVDGSGEFLPPFLSLIPLQCSKSERKLRYLAKFRNDNFAFNKTFRPDWTLIVEASWDSDTRQLFGFGCRILNLAENAVRDCTMRLSLRYPSVLNIRNEAKITGQIWSSKTVEDSGYFRKIDLTDTSEWLASLRGLRYEYTELGRARKSCNATKNGKTYPDGKSGTMSTAFDIFVKGQKCGWGSAVPIFVGSKIFEVDNTAPPENKMRSQNGPLNISYKISINLFSGVNWSKNLYNQMMITAEGVYDSETGTLCMVGCRKMKKFSIYTETDCDILARFEFASLRNNGDFLEGTIESNRTNEDPLHFPDLRLLSLSSGARDFEEATLHSSTWRLSVLVILNALSCILVWLQIRHVRRHPEVAPSVSLLMILVLSMGNIVSVAFSQRLKTDKLTSVLVSMIECLLHMRLLHIVWTAKSNQNKAWIREKTASFVCLSFCILLILLLNNSASYAGLMMDAFLVPQIVLNVLRDAAGKSLSAEFFVGTSALRVYRERNYPSWFDVEETYYNASAGADFYSSIMIPCGIVVLASIVSLQQRYGGRRILPVIRRDQMLQN